MSCKAWVYLDTDRSLQSLFHQTRSYYGILLSGKRADIDEIREKPFVVVVDSIWLFVNFFSDFLLSLLITKPLSVARMNENAEITSWNFLITFVWDMVRYAIIRFNNFT